MKRIIVIGSSGSGKTTLTRKLGEKLGYPVVDFDDLYWQPGWKPAPFEEFFRLADQATSGPTWIVIDPNSFLRGVIWDRADTIVWLDLPFWLMVRRLVRRSAWRIRVGEKICNGNVETWDRFFSKDGLLVWLLRFFVRKRYSYAGIFASQQGAPQKTYIRLRSVAEVQKFLEQAGDDSKIG
jgi:adenylate kinase family enzyme